MGTKFVFWIINAQIIVLLFLANLDQQRVSAKDMNVYFFPAGVTEFEVINEDTTGRAANDYVYIRKLYAKSHGSGTETAPPCGGTETSALKQDRQKHCANNKVSHFLPLKTPVEHICFAPFSVWGIGG
uniref:Uncharacterized protein n=1 Tax=Globodera rostochiensis TaxID=31243 RepID=A0A914HX54_GLORO